MTSPPGPDDDARAAALGFAQELSAFWADRLGPRLLGFYLIGSLAHGGFNRRYSDIDLALICEDGLADIELATMRSHAAATAPDLALKLSLFWADRDFSLGRFPPLDRIDYLDHAEPVVERERVDPDRPSLDEIRAYLAGAPFENWAESARRFAALDTLDPKDHKSYLRAQLYPARFIFSWMTGRIGSNDDAVAFLHQRRPAGIDLEVLTRALDCRRRAADPDDLFADREVLLPQIDGCARLAADGSALWLGSVTTRTSVSGE